MPWISFPSKYGFMDRLVSDNILATCICTENPPNHNINTINGNNVKDDNTYGNGINKIDINGGIGNIEINFKNSKD